MRSVPVKVTGDGPSHLLHPDGDTACPLDEGRVDPFNRLRGVGTHFHEGRTGLSPPERLRLSWRGPRLS